MLVETRYQLVEEVTEVNHLVVGDFVFLIKPENRGQPLNLVEIIDLEAFRVQFKNHLEQEDQEHYFLLRLGFLQLVD